MFLFGAGADVVVFTLYGVFPTYWGFLLLGGVMGLLDGSNSACFAVIVDCVTRGFMTGAPLPGQRPRALLHEAAVLVCARAPLRAARIRTEARASYPPSLIYMVMWARALGHDRRHRHRPAAVGYLGLAGGMASAGVLLLPYWLYLACYLAKDGSRTASRCSALLCSAFVNQAKSVRLLLRNRRMTLLTLINCLDDRRVRRRNILLYWYEYKFGAGRATRRSSSSSRSMLTVWGFLLVRICVKAVEELLSLAPGPCSSSACSTPASASCMTGTAVALFKSKFTSALWAIQPCSSARPRRPRSPTRTRAGCRGAEAARSR